MTEDYKEQLLKYVTGDLQNTSATTDEIIKEIINISRNGWVDYLPEHYTDFHFEDVIKVQNTDKYIMYGGYRAVGSTGIDNEVYGVIILLDNELNPIKSFYEFDSGTKLRYIQKLQQDADGTFYMVDDTIYAYNFGDEILNSTKRLIFLNNFTTKINDEYVLKLRKSYIFPSGYNTFKCEEIQKNPNQSQYVMVGKGYADWSNSYIEVLCIEVNIPYGESPTWDKKYIIQTVNTTTQRVGGKLGCAYIEFDGENYSIKTICSYYIRNLQTSTLSAYIRYYYKSISSSSFTSTNIMDSDIGFYQTDKLEGQAVFINNNISYFIISNLEQTTSGSQSLYIKLLQYNISNNILTTIYEKSYGTGVAANNEQLFLTLNQGELYVMQIINKGNNLGDYYIQRYNETWNPILVSENAMFIPWQRCVYVNNEFNLIRIFLYPTNPRRASWYFTEVKEIYNQNQYNGEPYVNSNVLSPLYSNLYSNGSLVFSRNLYNISKQNNMTMSSVEIPNTYLNDTTITTNDLISETNLQMNSNNNQWTKNIYEVVDLNFLNTITVIDEDTNTPYLQSAIKVNNAITDGTATDYQNTPCNKYRINYTDNTTSVENLTWTNINKTNKQTEITLYVDKAIISIDLISNDENTIYLTIPLDVVVGKYYTINQKIKIE